MYNDFMQVLDLIKNPDKYQAQLQVLMDKQQAIDASIAEMGVKGDIATAKQDAQSLVEQAKAIVEDAKSQATKIVTAAQTAFDKRNADLKDREIIADQKLANYNTMKATEAARNDALRQQEKQLAVMQKDLETQKATLATAQAEVDARLDKLRQAMG